MEAESGMKAYHITDPRNVANILREGLWPDALPEYHSWSGDIEFQEDKVFLAIDEENTFLWAKVLAQALEEREPFKIDSPYNINSWYFVPFAILEVDLEGLEKVKRSFHDYPQIEVSQHIPPDRITYLGEYTLIEDFSEYLGLPKDFDPDDMIF